jgi:hypothetical protein
MSEDPNKQERRERMKRLTDILVEDSSDGIDAVLELMERLADSQKPYLTKAERKLLRQWCSGTSEHHARVANTLKDYWQLFVVMDQSYVAQERTIKAMERTIKMLQDRLGDTE